MDLKEYIKSTITQISEAVSELNDTLTDTVVNPASRYETEMSGMSYVTVGSDIRPVTEIDFRIVIDARDDHEHGGKIGVASAVFGVGGAAKRIEEKGRENEINFKIRVLLPSSHGRT